MDATVATEAESKNALIVGVMANAMTLIAKNTYHVSTAMKLDDGSVVVVEVPAVGEATGTIATLVMEQEREEIVTTATEKDIN